MMTFRKTRERRQNTDNTGGDAQSDFGTPTMIFRQPRELKPAGSARNRHSGMLFALIWCVLSVHPAFSPMCRAMAQAGDVWIMIDTGTLTLSVMQGDSPVRTFENIAIGSNGTTWEKQTMDEKTPLGDFRISAIKDSSRFHLFFAIDYPTMEHAQRALEDGRISREEYQALQVAWKRGETPPQNTRLGGAIGIHGIGEGDPEIHSRFNWTNGCVAITNDEIDEIAGLVGIGTRVSIR